MLMLYLGMLLALLASFYVQQGISVHGWPIITVFENFESQGSATDVFPTDIFMNFNKDRLGFRGFQAMKERLGECSSV